MTDRSAHTSKNGILKKYLSPKYLNPLFNIFLISVIIASGLLIVSQATKTNFLSLTQKKETEKPDVSPSPLPTPRPLPHGKHGFTVQGGNRNAPQFGRGFLDPIDPQKNTQQGIIISASNSVPIDSVTAIIKTDNKETSIKLSVSEGTNTNGTWTGSWTVNDTYLYNYIVQIIAKAGNEEQNVELTLR